jgi:acetolactate synthase-1/2/3 large subunit
MMVASDWANDLASCLQETRLNYRKQLGPYADFPEIFRDAMPADVIWARDVTMNNTTWGNRCLPLENPSQNIYPVGAAIGPGFQFGIGAAFAANGRKTVAITGDGGFYLNMTELWTAAQEKPDVAIVIFNDAGYGVIKDIQDALYGERHYFADPIGPDLEGLANLAGIPYFRVSAVSEMGPQLKAAIETDGPTLVEVEMTKIGKLPRYYQPPPYAAKG